MKAIICTNYGPPEVLQLRDLKKPVPKDNEVLIRIRATTVSTADCELRRFDFPLWIWLPIRLWFGILRPRQPVLGQELAGDIESVGKDVRSFKKGDRVFATTGIGLGAYAEYICLREKPQTGAIAMMPTNLNYEEAAAHTLRRKRSPGVSAHRERPARTEGLGQRSGRQLRHVRSPTRQSPWGAGDRRGPCVEVGDAAHARRGSDHRLHARGLHRRV